MKMDVLFRVVHILRTQPGCTMPLSRLYAQLVQELGSRAGSYAEIYQYLRRQTGSFTLLNVPRVLVSAEGSGGRVRETYDEALEDAGLGSLVQVALTEYIEEQDPADVATALTTTVGELARLCGDDLALSGYVERATHELVELTRVLAAVPAAHPTTPPRDLPPAA